MTKAQYVVRKSDSPPFGRAEKLEGEVSVGVDGDVGEQDVPSIISLTGANELQYARPV